MYKTQGTLLQVGKKYEIYTFQDTSKFYTALVNRRSLLEPEDKLTVDLVRKEDQELKMENHLKRFLGEVDNQIISSGAYWHSSLSNIAPVIFL